MSKRFGWVFLAIAVAVLLLVWNRTGDRTGGAVPGGRLETSDRLQSGSGSAGAPAHDEAEDGNRRESLRHTTGEIGRNQSLAKKQKQMQLESQIRSMGKYEGDQLLVYAAGLDVPGNMIPTLYPQYLKMKRDLDALKIQGLGPAHPTVKAATAVVDGMKQQLDEVVAGLRTTLEARLEAGSESR